MSTAAANTPKLQPKQITIGDKEYTIYKFDCISGREIIAKYPVSNLPKLGDYKISEEVMRQAMCFVSVQTGDKETFLTTAALLQNHVPDWEALLELERALLAYNCSFFQDGKGLTSLAELAKKAAAWASKISTASLAELLQQVRQPSTNSGQSTH